jgi:hypothetical protein
MAKLYVIQGTAQRKKEQQLPGKIYPKVVATWTGKLWSVMQPPQKYKEEAAKMELSMLQAAHAHPSSDQDFVLELIEVNSL